MIIKIQSLTSRLYHAKQILSINAGVLVGFYRLKRTGV